MSGDRYPVEPTPKDRYGRDADDGTMPENVDQLRQAVVGRRIVKTEQQRGRAGYYEGRFIITLDDGTQVRLRDRDDCCAFTELEAFLLHPERVDHVIMGVGTTEEYSRWHIYADLGDVLELTVGWSAGNPFYYGYGFEIDVVALDEVQP